MKERHHARRVLLAKSLHPGQERHSGPRCRDRRPGVKRPSLIVAGRSPIRLLAATWKHTFAEVGMTYATHEFGGECSLDEIERIKQAARQSKSQVVIGAGGGKVLDAARAAAADLNLPVVNCPTVASSDAPCTALSVIYSADGVVEGSRIYRKNPDLVLVDTQVIAQSPPRLLVAGMGDALATWFEAKTCADGRVKNMRGGLSTQSALALAKLCYETLLADGADALRSIEAQVVTPALERLVEANTLLSGLGFESSGLAAAHAIHNGLTTASPTHAYLHGEKVAFGLLTQLVLEGQPRSVLDRVLGFATEVGLPITLAEIGLTDLTEEDLLKIAVRATADGETIHNEPFAVQPDMVADAIIAANAIGKKWKADNRPYAASRLGSTCPLSTLQGRRNRVVQTALLALACLLGLGSRRFSYVLPGFIAAFAGDTLWALAVFLGLALVLPRIHAKDRHARDGILDLDRIQPALPRSVDRLDSPDTLGWVGSRIRISMERPCLLRAGRRPGSLNRSNQLAIPESTHNQFGMSGL